MSSRPRAAIAIANYNGSEFLARTVRSVLAQVDADVRVLVVDNASTDESCAIVDAIVDSRVVLCRYDEHVSVTENWNRALDVATRAGEDFEFAALLHSDDTWEPEFLSRALAALERHSADVALGNTRIIDGEDRVVDRATFRRKQRARERIFDRSDRGRLLSEMDVFPCSWVARREYLAHFRFDERFRRAPDWEFWLRVFERPDRIVSVPDAWTRYRIHASNDTFTPATLRGMRDDELTIIREALERQPVDVRATTRARQMVDVRMAIRCGQVLVRGDWRSALELLGDMRRAAGTFGLMRAWLRLAMLPETRLALGDLIRSPLMRWTAARSAP